MGLCFDDVPCCKNKSKITKCTDQCNNSYLIEHCEIQLFTSSAESCVIFDKKAFCQFQACESGNTPCDTTHYFFLGTECTCGCNKPMYNKNIVYYLQKDEFNNDKNVLFRYNSEVTNYKVSEQYWCSENNPGTWGNIYMICADSEGRGEPVDQ